MTLEVVKQAAFVLQNNTLIEQASIVVVVYSQMKQEYVYTPVTVEDKNTKI